MIINIYHVYDTSRPIINICIVENIIYWLIERVIYENPVCKSVITILDKITIISHTQEFYILEDYTQIINILYNIFTWYL